MEIRKKTLIGLLMIVIIGIAIITLSIKYREKKDNFAGVTFRRKYGSIGIYNGNDCSINLQLFSFGKKPDFLEKPYKISFDNKEVHLKSLNLKEEEQINDLVVYSVNMVISIPNTGRQDVMKLIYHDETGDKEYDLGKMSFISFSDEPVRLSHGLDTVLLNGNLVYSFPAGLTDDFEIIDVLIADDEKRCEFDKEVIYDSTMGLKYTIRIDGISAEKGDEYIWVPVLMLNYNGEERKFVPANETVVSKKMTYEEIREYVKNALDK